MENKNAQTIAELVAALERAAHTVLELGTYGQELNQELQTVIKKAKAEQE